MKKNNQVVILSANTSWYLYNFRSSTIKAFIKEGYRVICLSPKDDFSSRLQGLGCQVIQLKIDNKGTNPIKDFILMVRMFFLYKKINPKIVFHFTIKNNIYGTLAAYFANVKAVNNITGLGTAFIQKNFISRVVKFLYRITQPLADVVYCQNIEDYHLLVSEGLVAKDLLKQLPGSGVDVRRFHPNLKKKYTKEHKIFTFLFSGRLLADKGFNELISAFKIINDKKIKCNLWVCGFVDQLNKSSIAIHQINDYQREFEWFTWLGSVDQIEETLAQVDCLVLPSYREGMPRSILEACSMEIPVITTDVPGCRNIISNQYNGLLCKSKDIESLKDALALMMNMSPDVRQEMGKNGRKHILKYYDERLVIQEAVKELIS